MTSAEVSGIQSTEHMVLVKQKALHTFGACNRSTHPGNKQEFFKSHFNLIIFRTDGPLLLQGKKTGFHCSARLGTQMPLYREGAHQREDASQISTS